MLVYEGPALVFKIHMAFSCDRGYRGLEVWRVVSPVCAYAEGPGFQAHFNSSRVELLQDTFDKEVFHKVPASADG